MKYWIIKKKHFKDFNKNLQLKKELFDIKKNSKHTDKLYPNIQL